MKLFAPALGILLLGLAPSAFPDTIDPLHGCIIGTSCTDNGTVTPTNTNPLPTFTFTVSPVSSPNNPGDLLVEILVPNDAAGAATKSYSISGTNAGLTDTSTIPATAAIWKGEWTSGGLDTFLGLTLGGGSPSNNITAWLPYTQANGDASATGYDVYQVDLGANRLQGAGTPTAPDFTLSGSSLPIASLLTGFLGSGSTFASSSDFISTANSGAIFQADAPPGGGGGGGGTVPEPSSVILFGSASLLIATAFRKKFSSRA